MSYTDRLAEAFALADMLHRRQHRKGSDVPYITHLMSVAALVGEYGGSEDQVIAALLHDAVEDQGGADTLSQIRSRFGDAVADFVDAASDHHGEQKPPWRERKQTFLDGLRQAPAGARLIVAADKLHNARALIRDYHDVSERLWDRFAGKRDGTLWYYRESLHALSEGWNHPILRELQEAVDTLETLAAR